MGENDLKSLKTEFPDKRKYVIKKLANLFEYFKCLDDYKKPADILKQENFFSNLKI